MDYPQAIVSILVLCITVLIGIPLWWNTTKVYRAVLPHTKIAVLRASSNTVTLTLNLYIDSHLQFSEAQHLQLEQQVNDLLKIPGFLTQWRVHKQVVDIAQYSQEEVCASVLSDQHVVSLLQYNLLVRRHVSATGFYHCPSSVAVLLEIERPEDMNEKVYSSMKELTALHLENMVNTNVDDAKTSREHPMPPSPGYEIAFTLAVGDPTRIKARWDIKTAVEVYFRPLLEQLNFLGPFNVSSQVVYYADINIKPKKEGEKYYFVKSKLPLMINPLESRLGSHMSTRPVINFVVFIPPKDQAPLYIRLKKGSPLTETSFHSPRWGGVLFFNPPLNTSMSSSSEPSLVDIPSEFMMQTFLSQFRNLFGLASDSSNMQLHHGGAYLAEYEKLKLMLGHTVLQIQSTLSTLSSLSELLDTIANIVIRDDIRELVEGAVLSSETAVQELNSGQILNAFHHSRDAFEKSEKAFYDASLLSLLYFPDDQKYAIYVPLFLPVALPIVLSFFKSLKFLKQCSSSSLKGDANVKGE